MEMNTGAIPTREALMEALNAKLLREQNLVLGILAGAGSALLGSLIWMGITLATEMQLGLVAIAVGAGVGYSVRFAGKGVTKIYGVIGAVFTLFSCVAGEVFTTVQYVASAAKIGFFEALSEVDFTILIPKILENSSPITYIIYGIGIYEGYKFSFRKLTPAEIHEAGLAPAPEPAASVPTTS